MYLRVLPACDSDSLIKRTLASNVRDAGLDARRGFIEVSLRIVRSLVNNMRDASMARELIMLSGYIPDPRITI